MTSTGRKRADAGGVALGVLVFGLLLFGVLAAGTSVAASSGWSVQPTPSVGSASADNYLSGVSCVSATFCMAAGDYANASHGYLTLFEKWNGRSWSVVPSPTEGGKSTANILGGISCASTTSCMAVGTTNAQALAEHWNGTRWSVVPVPPGNDVLNGVDCPSPSACVAVGYFDTKVENSRSLVESWNGANWSIEGSPNPGPASQYADASGPAHDLFEGVSCSSPRWCAAVGGYITPAGTLKNLAEEWNGTRWSIVPSPSKASLSNTLDAVSCTSRRFCMAVGSFQKNGYDTLVESWNGTRWSVLPSPDKGPTNLDDGLSAVSCLSSQSCVAAGAAGTSPAGDTGATLIESWDGTGWSLVPSPNEGPVSGLSGVSCALQAPCVAVGSHSSRHNGGTLAEVS